MEQDHRARRLSHSAKSSNSGGSHPDSVSGSKEETGLGEERAQQQRAANQPLSTVVLQKHSIRSNKVI